MVKKQNNKGLSLIETMIFIGVLTFVFIIIVNFFVLFDKGYAVFKANSRINTSAIISMERITRDIKSANSINTGLSILGAHPGKLVLNTGTSTTEFYIDNSVIKVKRDNVVIGSLTTSNVFIDKLIFLAITGTNSQLIKIEMDIRTNNGTTTKTETFLSSTVLRGRY